MYRKTRREQPKILVKGISTMKRLCTSWERKLHSNLSRSLNLSLNSHETKSSQQLKQIIATGKPRNEAPRISFSEGQSTT